MAGRRSLRSPGKLGADAGEPLPLPARPHRAPVIDCALRPTRRAGCDCKHRYCRAPTELVCTSPPPPTPLCLRSSRVVRTCYVILRPVSLAPHRPPSLNCHPPLPCPTSEIRTAAVLEIPHGTLSESIDFSSVGSSRGLSAEAFEALPKVRFEAPRPGDTLHAPPRPPYPLPRCPLRPVPPPPCSLRPAGHSLPGMRSVRDRAPPRFPC